MIAVSKNIEYYGVNSQNKLSWTDHIDRVSKRSRGMFASLRHNMRKSNLAIKSSKYVVTVSFNIAYFMQPIPETVDKKV